jgi:hypothetical protein
MGLEKEERGLPGDRDPRGGERKEARCTEEGEERRGEERREGKGWRERARERRDAIERDGERRREEKRWRRGSRIMRRHVQRDMDNGRERGRRRVPHCVVCSASRHRHRMLQRGADLPKQLDDAQPSRRQRSLVAGKPHEGVPHRTRATRGHGRATGAGGAEWRSAKRCEGLGGSPTSQTGKEEKRLEARAGTATDSVS